MSSKKNNFTVRSATSGSTNMMRRLFNAHREANKRGVPTDLIFEEQEKKIEGQRLLESNQISRREFLRMVGLGAAYMASLSFPLITASCSSSDSENDQNDIGARDVRIIIIGAGMAGLRCADVLLEHGHTAEIYEASDRIGGRVYTDSSTFSSPVEHGVNLYLANTDRFLNL